MAIFKLLVNINNQFLDKFDKQSTGFLVNLSTINKQKNGYINDQQKMMYSPRTNLNLGYTSWELGYTSKDLGTLPKTWGTLPKTSPVSTGLPMA